MSLRTSCNSEEFLPKYAAERPHHENIVAVLPRAIYLYCSRVVSVEPRTCASNIVALVICAADATISAAICTCRSSDNKME